MTGSRDQRARELSDQPEHTTASHHEFFVNIAERVLTRAQAGATGVRLSCQIVCDHDMTVRAISRLAGSGRPDPGKRPADPITPPPVWVSK